MADVAFLPIAIAVAPGTAAPAAVAVTPDAADPFADLLATLETAPAAPATIVPPIAATPATLPLEAPSAVAGEADGADAPTISDADANDDRKDAPAPASPLGEITAMLALVVPPPVAERAPPPAARAAEPAGDAVQAPPVTPAAATPDAPIDVPDAPTQASAEAAVVDAHPAAPRNDAVPSDDARRDAAAVIRALQTSTALGATVAMPASDVVAAAPPIAPTPATLDPSATAQMPIEAAPVASETLVPRRPIYVARANSPAAATPPTTSAEAAAADQPRAPRRVALAGVAMPEPPAAPFARADARAAADPIAAALPDDPVARQLNVTRDGQWLDTLARDIAAVGGQDGQLRFRLDPDHLGALTVAIAQGADGASVRLTASTEQARTILADAQPRLVAEARAQGLHLREASVETHTAPAPGAAGGQGTGQSNSGRGGDQAGLAAQLQQHQQQGRRQPAPDVRATPTRPAPTRTATARAADLYA